MKFTNYLKKKNNKVENIDIQITANSKFKRQKIIKILRNSKINRCHSTKEHAGRKKRREYGRRKSSNYSKQCNLKM